MEKEKKISKGIVIGCLMMVMALTIWVININDTYSTDSSTTPKCKTINGIAYKYVSNATNDQHGCCPVSDTAKIGSLGSGNKCFSNTVNGSCPAGYTLMNDSSGNCIANLGQVEDSACYYCTGGSSVTGSNYLWSSGIPSESCNGGSWQVKSNITSSENCKNTTNSYEVTFSVNVGSLYVNGVFNSRNVISLSKLDYSIYTAKKDKYKFNGWDSSSACSSPKKSGTLTIKEKTTVYACYSIEITPDYYYFLKFDARLDKAFVYENNVNTGSKIYTSDQIKEGTNVNLNKYKAVASGYTFKGWSTSSSCSQTITSYKVTGTKTLYACYDENSSSTDDPKVYKVTFNPNGGTWSDGKTIAKVKVYTSRKYFSDLDLAITKTGYTFKGWKNGKGDVFTVYVDSTDDNSTLTAIWQANSTPGGTVTPGHDTDIGDENNCEYISKDSCEIGYSGYNCVKDSNNCYIKGSKKQTEDNTCTYNTKTSCENAYSGYNCVKDDNNCYIKGSKKNNGSDDSQDPSSNPNTGSIMLYISVLIGLATLGYSIYYANKIKSKEGI